MKIYVFVYGSLKIGYVNNYVLADSKFISNGKTCDKFQMYPVIGGAYPFLIKSEKVSNIIGEVFEVNSQMVLDNLDTLEGYPEYYLKEFIDIEIEDGSVIQALTYFKNEVNYPDSLDKSQPMTEWF